MTNRETLEQVVLKLNAGGFKLSPAQRECLVLVASGMSQREIAAHRHTAFRTVQSHLYEGYLRLGISADGGMAGLRFLGLVIEELLKMAESQESSNANG